MQSDDTIDSSDPKFDESMDVNVSVCSLILRRVVAEECDQITDSSASFFTSFRPSTKLDQHAKNEQNHPSSSELFSPPMVDTTFNKNGSFFKVAINLLIFNVFYFFTVPASKTKIVYTCNNCARTFISRLEFDKHYR